VRELASADAFEGLALPLTAGDATLAALPPVARAAVAPFAGQAEPVSQALRAWIGAGLPAPGLVEGAVAWAGIGQWLVTGHEPGEVAARLHDIAAVADQSDAWAGLRLTGGAAAEVLARSAPLDLHPRAFPPGAAARTLLRHVPLLMSRGETGFDLLVPRSYARTAVEDLVRAMRLVAGRAAL
jgi:heterotetrameric sarcosine oxidase gamma subunit